jgi:CHAT domain-containing protein
LQSAFFAAGAQRVLSTLWEIQSEVTEEWMATFYRHLQTGLLPPVALRRTQLEFIQHREFGHPVYWAAFACSRR